MVWDLKKKQQDPAWEAEVDTNEEENLPES